MDLKTFIQNHVSEESVLSSKERDITLELYYQDVMTIKEQIEDGNFDEDNIYDITTPFIMLFTYYGLILRYFNLFRPEKTIQSLVDELYKMTYEVINGRKYYGESVYNKISDQYEKDVYDIIIDIVKNN